MILYDMVDSSQDLFTLGPNDLVTVDDMRDAH